MLLGYYLRLVLYADDTILQVDLKEAIHLYSIHGAFFVAATSVFAMSFGSNFRSNADN